MDYTAELARMGAAAQVAARSLATTSTAQKNRCLKAMAKAIVDNNAALTATNAVDVEAARQHGANAQMLRQLQLDAAGIDDFAQTLQTIAALPDPVGAVDSTWLRPNGLEVKKLRVPIGVVAMIYEARPKLTVDSAGLCLKAGNSVILRGGNAAFATNTLLVQIMQDAVEAQGLPGAAIQLLPWTDRAAVVPLLRMNTVIDLIIPRGGEQLMQVVLENATVPVIKHHKGVCHMYVDDSADLEMALRLIENAKCQNPFASNAIKTLLLQRRQAQQLLPRLAEMAAKSQIELRGDPDVCAAVAGATTADDADWFDERPSRILAVRIVDDLETAMRHISRYGSGHSDVIVTTDKNAALDFTRQVDSAAVYVNVSSRFTDGNQFGMGIDIGISTDRLHARGPMGLQELTTYKYVVTGDGQVRA